MTMTSDISSRVISAVLRLVFMAAATVFAVSLLQSEQFRRKVSTFGGMSSSSGKLGTESASRGVSA